MTSFASLKELRKIGLKIFPLDIWIYTIEKYVFETDESLFHFIFTHVSLPWIENFRYDDNRNDLNAMKLSLKKQDQSILIKSQKFLLARKKYFPLSPIQDFFCNFTLIYNLDNSYNIGLIGYKVQDNEEERCKWELICLPSDLFGLGYPIYSRYRRDSNNSNIYYVTLNQGNSLVEVLTIFLSFSTSQSTINSFLNHTLGCKENRDINFVQQQKYSYLLNVENDKKKWKLIRYKAIAQLQSILKYVIWKAELKFHLSIQSFIDVKSEQKITLWMKYRGVPSEPMLLTVLIFYFTVLLSAIIFLSFIILFIKYLIKRSRKNQATTILDCTKSWQDVII